MRQMTTIDGQVAQQPDLEASLRADLAAQLARAQIELASQLSTQLANSGAPEHILNLRDQLMAIAALQESVATTRGASLTSLRDTVQITVTNTTALAQQIQHAANTGAALASSGAAIRTELASTRASLFEQRIFDPYLSFSSPEEETAYRRREAEARRYIDTQLAARTPEGDLNASGATLGQMLDAHAHGAGKSSEFLPQWNRLVETTERHRTAMLADGRSTAEFDRNLKASVRRYLKARGMSDADIDPTLDALDNPLEMVKPFLKDRADVAGLSLEVGAARRDVEATKEPVTEAAELLYSSNASPAVKTEQEGLADVMATFRNAGVKVGPSAAQSTHQTVGTTASASLSSFR